LGIISKGENNLPVARNYKPGSIIYFEGDKSANEIFILQQGKVILKATSIDTGEEEKEAIAPGEFFGVKSVLGRYPREEDAQAVTQSIVLVLNLDEFEKMVMGNFRILMKMLKVFSNQLRRIGKKVRELMQKGEPKMPATELFYIGEYYAGKGKAEQAKYVYQRYLEEYPDGQFAGDAKTKLEAIERGEIAAEAPTPASAGEPETAVPEEAVPPAPAEESQSLEDIFDTPGTSVEEPVKPEVLKTPGGVDVTKKFYEASSMASSEKYEEAIEIYKSISSLQKLSDDETRKFVEKSIYETGQCYIKLGKYMEAIETFSNLLKRFSMTELLKQALFSIGDAYALIEKYDKAINFYQKVVNTPPRQEINDKAKEKLEEIQKKL